MSIGDNIWIIWSKDAMPMRCQILDIEPGFVKVFTLYGNQHETYKIPRDRILEPF